MWCGSMARTASLSRAAASLWRGSRSRRGTRRGVHAGMHAGRHSGQPGRPRREAGRHGRQAGRPAGHVSSPLALIIPRWNAITAMRPLRRSASTRRSTRRVRSSEIRSTSPRASSQTEGVDHPYLLTRGRGPRAVDQARAWPGGHELRPRAPSIGAAAVERPPTRLPRPRGARAPGA